MDTTTVTMHAEGFGEARPAFNIKIGAWPEVPQSVYDEVMTELGLPAGDFSPAWVAAHVSENAHNAWVVEAASSLLDALCDEAKERLGAGVTFEQEGRQGGWLAVDGLPNVMTWDAQRVATWAELEALAGTYVESWPAETVRLIGVNAYVSELEACAVTS